MKERATNSCTVAGGADLDAIEQPRGACRHQELLPLPELDWLTEAAIDDAIDWAQFEAEEREEDGDRGDCP